MCKKDPPMNLIQFQTILSINNLKVVLNLNKSYVKTIK